MTITVTTPTTIIVSDSTARGPIGNTPNITIGTVTTGAPGSSASASVSGNSANVLINLTIPRGNTGNTGETGSANPEAYDQANAAYGQANAAYGQANTARTTANDAYGQANTARDTANGAYAQANGAYAQANAAYDAANAATAATVDITDTNGLTTVYYPTFVENRANGQIVRADVDLSYRTDTNTLTVGNVAANNNVSANNLIFADYSVQKTAFAVATIKTSTNSSQAVLSSAYGTTNSITTIGNQLSLRVIYDDSSGTNANVQYQFATTRSVRGRSTLTTASAVTCAAVGGTPVTGSQWYSLGVLNNEADTLVATLGDESFHGLYRITFICRELASNVASGYASIETLQTPDYPI